MLGVTRRNNVGCHRDARLCEKLLSFADLFSEPTFPRVLVDSPVKPANDK